MNAPDEIEDLRSDLGRAIKLIADKADEYTKAWEYVQGTRPETFDSRAAQAIIEQSKTTPLSFAHVPVEVIADKVELASITSPAPNARRALETWAEANDLTDESADWIYKACAYGDYYVVTDPEGLDEDGNPTVEDIDSVGMSPLSTVVIYDKKTQRKPLYGAHLWNAGGSDDPKTHAILYYDDASVKLVAKGHDASEADAFEFDVDLSDEDDSAFIEHDGGRMLITHLAVGGKPYGVPIHRKAWGPQDAITKISANNLVNVDSLGLPSRWALVDPNAEIDDDIDDDFGDDSPSTSAERHDGRRNATTGRRVRTVPGAIEYLRGVSETGTYDTAESNGFLANLDWYVRAMAVACGIALHEFDMKGDQPSGESRRRAEGRQNRIAARVKRQAGAFFEEIARTVLAVAGIADADVSVTFNPSETSTDKDGLELVSSKVKAGVPLRQALLEAGYTTEQVDLWYPTEAPAFSAELASMVAETLSRLGTAKTLGAIDDTGIAAMIPELFAYAGSVAVEGVDEDLVTDVTVDSIVTSAGTEFKARADALGILIRAGADPEAAADAVESGSFDGLTFPNVPVNVRIPEAEASTLESAGAPTGPRNA